MKSPSENGSEDNSDGTVDYRLYQFRTTRVE